MKVYAYVPDLKNPNSTIRVSLEVTEDKFDFSDKFKKSRDYPKKDQTNKYGYTRESLLAKAKELYDVKRQKEEANRQYALLVRQSMFAETGGMLGACVMPTIALGVMVAFIAPLTALFPSFIALAGVSTAIFLMAAIVGNITGTLAGMAVEYMTRPENSMIAAI